MLVLALSACGEVSEGAVEAGETDDATLYSVTFNSDLYCEVADGYEGGGASCNWDDFVIPTSWNGKTGEMEVKSTGNSTTSVHRYEDGHLCVIVNGYNSSDIDCFFPKR